jgi:hypothetical protein
MAWVLTQPSSVVLAAFLYWLFRQMMQTQVDKAWIRSAQLPPIATITGRLMSTARMGAPNGPAFVAASGGLTRYLGPRLSSSAKILHEAGRRLKLIKCIGNS